MKKLLLATTCLALSSTVSMAADMSVPYTKAPVIAAPVFTWTGCYLGAHGGGGTMTSNFEGSTTTNDMNGKGAVAGGQVGCNYQDGNFVIGLEGEGYWSNIKVTNSSSSISSGLTTSTSSASLTNRDDFTFAARAGLTLDRTLIYAKGGWAWGNLKGSSISQSIGSPPFTSSFSGNADGFLVGVGVEHALTRNWTVKLEYDYIGFGNKEVAVTNCSGSPTVCGVPGTFSFSATKQLFKVGANYLFDIGGAPLVAKY